MNISYYIGGDNHMPLKYFAKELGIRHAVAPLPAQKYAPYMHSYDYVPMLEHKQSLNDFGLSWDVLEGVPGIEKCKLGLPGRDEEIERTKVLFENMSRLGVRTACYNWMPVWGWYRTRKNMILPGGSVVTGFYEEDLAGAPDCPVRITKEQLWENLEYFLKRIVPVAEKYRIELAVHPDDPPIDEILGVERILTSADAMWDVTRLVPSEFNGITLCQGNFAAMGEDVPAQIRRFGRAGTLFFSHFRDVSGQRNAFHEVYHFDGMTDMYECMKAYYEVGFRGTMRPDHVPTMYGDDNSRPGYAINGNLVATGYMIGLMEAARKELGLSEEER